MAQYVYIIGASRDGPLKVGISANPIKRLSELQTGHAYRLEVFWVYPCPRGDILEPLIHRVLAPFRLSGEWFNVPIEKALGALWATTLADKDATEDDLHICGHHIGLECTRAAVGEECEAVREAAE